MRAIGGLAVAYGGAIALALLPVAPAWAQNAPAASPESAADARTRELIENARQAYAIPRKLTRCEEAAGNEIVVCAHEEDEAKYRTEGSAGSTNTGVPHADVGHHALPGGVSARGCFLQKCPKPVYLIDLSKIPLPPPGSDADKIAKGEMRAP